MTDTASKIKSDADDRAMHALSNAGAFCGECGFEPGERGCPECERCWSEYVKALREAGWAPRSETLREAARLNESTNRDDDATALLDNLADAAERDETGEGISPCTASLLPLGTAPVEPCVKRGPHGFHRNAAGWTWTDEDLSDF